MAGTTNGESASSRHRWPVLPRGADGSPSGQDEPIEKLQRERDEARAERDLLAQAMFDAWAALGFDTDGDTAPGAQIAGARFAAGKGSRYAKWGARWLLDVRQHRQDDDDSAEEWVVDLRELAKLRAALKRVRAAALRLEVDGFVGVAAVIQDAIDRQGVMR